jgi:polar amino acid transport system permease protein
MINLGEMWNIWWTYYPVILAGLWMTIFLTITSMALALVVGLGIAMAKLNRHRWYFYWPAQAFVEIERDTPLLLQLFFLYFVLPLAGIRIDPIPTGILGLGLNTGAYLSEVIRAGIEAVPKGQLEASRAIGLTYRQTMRIVVLPQALRIVIPPIGNYFVSLFKDTALVSTISIQELLFTTRLVAAQNFRYFEVFTIALILYFIVSFPAAYAVRSLERRWQVVK